MATYNKKRSTGRVIFASVILLILVIALVGVAVYASKNGFATENNTNFYIVVEQEKVTDTLSGIYIGENKPLNVQVKYELNSKTIERDYDVKVIAKQKIDLNTNSDSTYLQSVAVGDDLTQGFILKPIENGFSIVPCGSLYDILNAAYPDKFIDINSLSVVALKNLFSLIVTSFDGKKVISVDFGLLDGSGMVLDKKEIVF